MDLASLQKLLASFKLQLKLYDLNGSLLYPTTGLNDARIKDLDFKSSIIKANGVFYLNVDNYVIASLDISQESKDLLSLLESILKVESNEDDFKPKSLEDLVYYLITENNLKKERYLDYLNYLNANDKLNYLVCLIIFDNPNSLEISKELYPSDTGDFILQIGSKSLVAIHLCQEDSVYESFEFFDALYQSFLEEYFINPSIGISLHKNSLYDVKKAVLEARRAIAIGEKLNTKRRLYSYSSLILERCVLELPSVFKENIVKTIFNQESLQLLDDTMLHTAEAFLENDINLTDTAKALYIHRNTLLYRLDKLQKCFGLNLKRFNDASVFKLLLTILKLTKDTGENEK